MTLFYAFCAILLLTFACGDPSDKPDGGLPMVLHPDISLTLIDSHPSIQTPIGLAIDSEDHLYVLESHTHTPLKNYPGPSYDRIKKSSILNEQKEPGGWIIFADGISDGMNLIWHEGYVYLVEKNRVIRLRDNDGDGVADSKQVLLEMHTPRDVYDHAGLLGICVGPGGQHLYISRGNTGGQRWQVKALDESLIQGFGDGGNIFRCRLDGSKLEEVATGFWNPFDITFDRDGRLLASDNDPDSRGPNRLLDIVMGGNYGYESLYGGSGIHPFLSWNGELPGTLPYAAALGEAPTGIIDGRLTNLFAGDSLLILAQIWEENSIAIISLEDRKDRLSGQSRIFIQGDHEFHPVAFAVNSLGDLYFTDWVIRQYPNHGHGKLWKLKNNQAQFQPSIQNDRNQVERSIAGDPMSLLRSGNAFERHLVRTRVVSERDSTFILTLLAHEETNLNIQGVLLASELNLGISSAQLQKLLDKRQARLSTIVFKYVTKTHRQDAIPILKKSLEKGVITSKMIPAYLETVRQLRPEFVAGVSEASDRRDPRISHALPSNYIWEYVQNDHLAASVRSQFLRLLDQPDQYLPDLLELDEERQQQELAIAIMTITKGMTSEELVDYLLAHALDSKSERGVRIQALIALSYQEEDFSTILWPLLSSADIFIRYTAQWYFCDCDDERLVAKARHLAAKEPEKFRILQFCHSTDQPQKTPTGVGNAERGAIIYQLKRHQCTGCHQINGDGGHYGPDLSQIGSSKNASQLRMSILDPSAEIAPEWQGWYLIDQDGNYHIGRQIDIGLNSAKLMHQDGQFLTHEHPKDYGLLETSLMPDHLDAQMTTQAFEDLIQYLLSLQ